MRSSIWFAAALALGAGPGQGASLIKVPPGFVVERVAEPPLVEHPVMACFDDRGRLFVCESAGLNLKAEELLKQLPDRILRLEDTDGDGRFDRRTVFADRMSFPQGVLWHDGALYTASPPSIWRLEDSDGDGVADKRQEIVTKFGFTGNAADIHGPVLGPDGRIYWADGRHGHHIERSDGALLEGKAARIFRARPDGREVEVLCGGGMDNPVEIAFTSEGEALVTVAILISRPARIDAIIHAVEGGAWPHSAAVLGEFKKTGDLLPAMTELGWVAPAGLMRHRSGAFGPDYRDNFFSALFNTHRVQRHVVERQGATFRSRNEDFLVSSDPDSHFTDVLEDADGSMIVVDTGGWFRIGCPTSQIAKPEIRGAIYRVRREGAPRPEDPRGLKADWSRPETLLDDPRFAVRDRALREVARNGSVEALRKPLASPSARERRNAVWALTRIDAPEARALVRGVLSDQEQGVRHAAVRSAGLHRDAGARDRLMEIVRADGRPEIRREAATALGRIGHRVAVPALLEALRPGGDRFLEHALIYSLILLRDREALVGALGDGGHNVRRGALIALDQMDGGNLTQDMVTPLLDPSDPALQQAALGVITSRPDWAREVTALTARWLEQPALEARARENLQGVLVAFARDAAIQDLAAKALRRAGTPAETRLLVLESMARAPLDRLPPTWLAEARWSLDHAEERVARQAVATLRASGSGEFDEALLRLARDGAHSIELRVEAAAAAAPRVARLERPLFDLLAGAMAPDRPPLLRLAAAEALGRAGHEDAQLNLLSARLAAAGALEVPKLLPAYEKSRNGEVGKRFVAALGKSPGLASLAPEALMSSLKSFPLEIRESAKALLAKLEVDAGAQKARLDGLEPLLREGDAARGREVYLGSKGGCSACHAVAGQGGRVGPDLTKIGSIRSGRDLLESTVFPSASFARGYEPYILRTKDGQVHGGIIARETPEAIYLYTTERAEMRISRSSIEVMQASRVSVMPQGLDAQLSRAELADLVAYLSSLR